MVEWLGWRDDQVIVGEEWLEEWNGRECVVKMLWWWNGW
jgi:hypothetical protein